MDRFTGAPRCAQVVNALLCTKAGFPAIHTVPTFPRRRLMRPILRTAAVVAAADVLSWVSVAASAESGARFRCWTCVEGGEYCANANDHFVGIVSGSISPEANGPTHQCIPGGCGLHCCCGELANLIDDVGPAVVERRVDRLAALARKYPNVVKYNASRRSYQVEGCNGLLVANVPVASQ